MVDFSQIWTEKYRPKNLDEMINQKAIVEKLKAFVKDGSIPHMLFAGPPGTGKTTAALCLAHELFGDSWRENYMETNASDERGIDVVRNKIKDFARTRSLGGKFKIIFLDEADALTKDAQQALRRTMENFSRSCRFILSCNYPGKIIEPIQSRTVVFRFKPFQKQDVQELLERVAKGEGLEIEKKALEALMEISEGDARVAVNLLQSSAAKSNRITEKDVYESASSAKAEDVSRILELALSGRFSEARKKMQELLIDSGVSAELFLRQLHKQILGSELATEKKAALLDALAEFEFRILEGANEFIQLDALLARLSAMGGN